MVSPLLMMLNWGRGRRGPFHVELEAGQHGGEGAALVAGDAVAQFGAQYLVDPLDLRRDRNATV
jgi:hypothetical protein